MAETTTIRELDNRYHWRCRKAAAVMLAGFGVSYVTAAIEGGRLNELQAQPSTPAIVEQIDATKQSRFYSSLATIGCLVGTGAALLASRRRPYAQARAEDLIWNFDEKKERDNYNWGRGATATAAAITALAIGTHAHINDSLEALATEQKTPAIMKKIDDLESRRRYGYVCEGLGPVLVIGSAALAMQSKKRLFRNQVRKYPY
jgi:hypothetical protein